MSEFLVRMSEFIAEPPVLESVSEFPLRMSEIEDEKRRARLKTVATPLRVSCVPAVATNASRSPAARKPLASRSPAARKPLASCSPAARQPLASHSPAICQPLSSRSPAASQPPHASYTLATTHSTHSAKLALKVHVFFGTFSVSAGHLHTLSVKVTFSAARHWHFQCKCRRCTRT